MWKKNKGTDPPASFDPMASFEEKGWLEFSSPIHGNGIIAKKAFEQGDIVFQESPMFMLQSIENRQHVVTCGQCMVFLGSRTLQLDVLKGNVSRQDDEILSTFCCPCEGHCGEYYCGETCRQVHYELRGHKWLCTGPIKEGDIDHPLIKFKVHAMETNEIFLLVAMVFSSICHRAETLMATSPYAKLTINEALLIAARPLEEYVRQEWWEAAVPPKEYLDDEAEEGEEEKKETKKKTTTKKKKKKRI